MLRDFSVCFIVIVTILDSEKMFLQAPRVSGAPSKFKSSWTNLMPGKILLSYLSTFPYPRLWRSVFHISLDWFSMIALQFSNTIDLWLANVPSSKYLTFRSVFRPQGSPCWRNCIIAEKKMCSSSVTLPIGMGIVSARMLSFLLTFRLVRWNWIGFWNQSLAIHSSSSHRWNSGKCC